MNKYIDGFLIPIAKDKIDLYRGIAAKACKIWMEHGALDYVEALGDDLNPNNELRSFQTAADAGEGDAVIFAYIVFESREHRDQVNAKVMADPRLHEMCDKESAPFEMHRMSYGGFRSIVAP